MGLYSFLKQKLKVEEQIDEGESMDVGRIYSEVPVEKGEHSKPKEEKKKQEEVRQYVYPELGLLENTSKNFIEEGLGIAPEAEEYSDAKEMFNAVLKADNESDFIAALNDFRDNLLGGAFADISDTDLAKYLDDIYDTYDSDGNLRNVCNIITVLK